MEHDAEQALALRGRAERGALDAEGPPAAEELAVAEEGEHAEEMAQKDYENLMAASQKTRATNAESITEKESASAEWTEKIENAKTEQASTTEALAKLKEYIAGLHSSCDFLMENYGARKEARTNEVEGLKNAKSVLAGANFS